MGLAVAFNVYVGVILERDDLFEDHKEKVICKCPTSKQERFCSRCGHDMLTTRVTTRPRFYNIMTDPEIDTAWARYHSDGVRFIVGKDLFQTSNLLNGGEGQAYQEPVENLVVAVDETERFLRGQGLNVEPVVIVAPLIY